MPLFQDSQQTPERRSDEAKKLLEIIAPHLEELSSHNYSFVKFYYWRIESQETKGVKDIKLFLNTKQLFRLRDIASKFQ
jgi:hypothetical protein